MGNKKMKNIEALHKEISLRSPKESNGALINRMFIKNNLVIFQNLSKDEKLFFVSRLHNFSNHTYILQFMLCSPELWENFSLNEWEYLLQTTSGEGLTSLLLFIYCYLKIDAFETFFCENSVFKEVINSYKESILSFVPFPSYSEDEFNDFLLAGAHYFEETSVKLIKQGGIPVTSLHNRGTK